MPRVGPVLRVLPLASMAAWRAGGCVPCSATIAGRGTASERSRPEASESYRWLY